MGQIIRILNCKWSNILAFVPGVNILYLFFHFLTVHDQRSNITILILTALIAPICVIAPNAWDWAAVYLVLSGITLVFMQKSRGKYESNFRFPIAVNNIPIVSVIILFLSLSGRLIPILYEVNVVSNNLYKALDAIVYNDEAAWHELIHPVYGQELMDFDKIIDDIQADGIVLTQNYQTNRGGSSSNHDVDDGRAIGMDKLISTGDEVYRVTVVYQISDTGSGFTEFDIEDAFP